MITNQLAKQLHDKATRGELLSTQEQIELKSWYAQEDTAEAELLNLLSIAPNLSPLHEQIDAALAQLTMVAARVQTVSTENEVLRHEIAELRRRLSHLLTPQFA